MNFFCIEQINMLIIQYLIFENVTQFSNKIEFIVKQEFHKNDYLSTLSFEIINVFETCYY